MKRQLLGKSIGFFRHFRCRFQVMLLLFMLCGQQGFTSPLLNEHTAIKRSRIESKAEVSVLQTEQVEKVSGVVKDIDGITLPGVAVVLVGSMRGTATDADGVFAIEVPKGTDVRLLFSFIGMESQEIAYKGKPLQVVLRNSLEELDEVVVTGLFERKSESFTGSVSTYKAKDLKMIGKQNILQSLKTLDPSFNLMTNNEFGSDPNQSPDIEIRGKSSVVGVKGAFENDPNQPLFILDGFETSIQTILDMNMERVESITLLKDAASTAIYGSRAANGVVVVETKSPAAGELRINYNADFSISIPDLTDYNLMNSAEKLEFERLAGVYTSTTSGSQKPQYDLDRTYNQRLSRVKSGVDSYWLSSPVRTGVVHKHNLYLEGGDESMRYGAGISYAGTNGVMKKSDRDVLSANFDLLYRKGKFRFTNKLNVDHTTSHDPTIGFDEYADANPYYVKHEDFALLEMKSEDNKALRYVSNPLYDDQQNNLNEKSYFSVTNNLQLEYEPLQSMKIRGRFGITKSNDKIEVFKSPYLGEYLILKDESKHGYYTKRDINNLLYNGDITVQYGQAFAEKHLINFVGGASFDDSEMQFDEFAVEGFIDDELQNPTFGNEYPENSKADYGSQHQRAMSLFANAGYSYDNRFLIDANIRLDGASLFGSYKKYTTTWSTGVSWNVHNESFLKKHDVINLLKLRSSIGNPGNQSFGNFNTANTYAYVTNLQNSFGIAAIIAAFGNPDLDWQKTLDLNVGLDIAVYRNRLKISADFYRKETDPLLVIASAASSTGQTQFATNLGGQLTKGISGTISYSPIYRIADNFIWTITANARHQVAEYINIGNSLDHMNTELQGGGTSLTRYKDGGSPTAIWAVKSAGIDPMTGQEVFLTKENEKTFDHDYSNEVVVGNTEPKLEGVVGTSLYYKGLSFSAFLRYRVGADIFNSALYDKVENITADTWTNNLDKRALTDRWQKPGDVAQFKGIGLVEELDPMSNRFVQRENSIVGESFSLGYEFSGAKWLERAKLTNVVIKAYMNDIFRASTVKAERGIEYPFARSVSFALNLTF